MERVHPRLDDVRLDAREFHKFIDLARPHVRHADGFDFTFIIRNLHGAPRVAPVALYRITPARATEPVPARQVVLQEDVDVPAEALCAFID